jgi:hypothetical protein
MFRGRLLGLERAIGGCPLIKKHVELSNRMDVGKGCATQRA